MTRAITDPMRLHGRYYTPTFVVEVMLRLTLDPLLKPGSPPQSPPLRILDPACGDGAFLLPIGERLRDWYKFHGIVRDGRMTSHLFGVDIDREALASLNSRLESAYGSGADRQANLRWGDALTGPGFGESTCSKEFDQSVSDLDWQSAFSDAAQAGGFDLVIGNPPYRRELASMSALERLRKSPLGERWHQPRLDLWAYFLHRGLEVLKPGGRLAFILPSYWTASKAAGQLIDRLQAETTLREIILLGKTPVFPNVSGRHLILSLVKGRREEDCKVWDLSSAGKRLANPLSLIPETARGTNPYSLRQSELFEHHQLRLTPANHRLQISGQSYCERLEERFEVRQGIVENPRRITRKMAALSGSGHQVGEGVFVLSEEELDRLNLSPFERKLLRPYYRGTDIGRYRLAAEPSEWLLYLTRETACDLDAFPHIKAHLGRFRPLLGNRREVKLGRISWWHLHWPREEGLFLAPRIIMPQMGIVPRFVFCERPAFVGFAMHVIRQRPVGNSPSPHALCRTDRRAQFPMGRRLVLARGQAAWSCARHQRDSPEPLSLAEAESQSGIDIGRTCRNSASTSKRSGSDPSPGSRDRNSGSNVVFIVVGD